MANVATVIEQFNKNSGNAPTVNDAYLSELNNKLSTVAFLNNNEFSVIDLVTFKAIHSYIAALPDPDKAKIYHVIRWFDQVQHLPGVANALSVSIVPIIKNLKQLAASKKPVAAAAPAPAAPAAQEKAKPQAEAPKAEPKKGGVSAEEKAKLQQEKAEAAKKAKQERAQAAKEKAASEPKKERPPKQNKAPQKPAEPEDPRSDIEHIDIRVGKIVSVKRHPDADALYVEEIDLGEGKPRTIISGLVNFVPIAEMENRVVVVLANLPARKMRGIESHGMVLCASNGDKSKVEPLLVPEGTPIGERIFFGAAPSEHKPDAELNPKKKFFEKVQPDWKTNDDRVALYKNLPFNTSKGPLTAASISGGSIS